MNKFRDPEGALQNAIAFSVGERRRLIFACISLLLVLLLATWIIINNSQQKLIEFKSRQIANVVATQAKAARSLYSSTVVAKLKRDGFSASTESDHKIGSVPIPAQFLKALSHKSSENDKNDFLLRPLSKWNLSPEQGLKDDFQRWAWLRLEQQVASSESGTTHWDPVWRIETVGGTQALRYLVADPAASQSCVDCHNSLENTPAIQALRKRSGVKAGKVWKVNDLMGALEVIVPVHESSVLAAEQTKFGLLMVLVVAITGIFFVLGISAIDGVRTLAVNRNLEYQARTDSLTDLPNRSGFNAKVNALLHENKEHASNAVMLLDLNDFKRINDTLGHHVGDDVLKEIARRLEDLISEPAVIARLGGDEFVLFLPNTNEADVRSTAQLVIDSLEKNIEIGEYRMNAGASIGIANMPEHGTNMHELLRCADVAMYCAKRDKSGYEFYNIANDHNHINTLSIIGDFRTALENNGLSQLYQPKFDIENGTVCSVEALLRWDHPEHGMISPLRIIPMAENSGQIAALTRWTVDTGLAQLNRWHDNGYDIKLAVNLSAKMLHDDKTVEMMLGLLADHDVSSDRLIIEVTETAVMTNTEKAIQLLNALRQAGVILSLDDFGTGYSSLSYVSKLPMHELKLDRSFIDDLSNVKNKAIVRTAIELAANLDLDFIAEGVEDAETLAQLLDINCTKVQGYYLCKPLPGDVITEQLDDLCALAYDWQQRGRIKYSARGA